MKQMTEASQMVALSPIARTKLNKWLREKDYGVMLPDGEFFPTPQLTIGQLIEFIEDHDKTIQHVLDALVKTGDHCDNLFDHMQEILEEKN